MSLRLALVGVVCWTTASPASACSYAVREHPILASKAPLAVEPGATAVNLAIDEGLLPNRYARNPENVWFKDLSGLRGTMIGPDGTVNGPAVVVQGKISLSCFYPTETYARTADGKLIVWVAGTASQSDGRMTIKLADQTDAAPDLVWTRIRWGGIE